MSMTIPAIAAHRLAARLGIGPMTILRRLLEMEGATGDWFPCPVSECELTAMPAIAAGSHKYYMQRLAYTGLVRLKGRAVRRARIDHEAIQQIMESD